MKTINSILIFTVLIAAAIYAVSFSGCSDTLTNTGTGTTKTYKARTEKDFADRNLKAEPGAVIVLNLEDLHGKLDPEEFDTDLIGVDIIPYTFTETAEHKISIGDSSYFTVTLINEASKVVIYELTPQNPHTTVTIPAGDYLLVITSLEEFGTDSTGRQVVFIQPDMEGTIKNGGQSNTDYDPRDLQQLISTRHCQRCDLSNVNFMNANLRSLTLLECNLTGANLAGADLSSAKIFSSNFEEANFTGANLYLIKIWNSNFKKANFRNANIKQGEFQNSSFKSTNFTGANMHKTTLLRSIALDAVLDSTFLHDAVLESTNFTQGHFKHTNLTGANLQKSIFNKTDLSYSKFGGAKLWGASFCDAVKIGIIGDVVYTNNATQCWP